MDNQDRTFRRLIASVGVTGAIVNIRDIEPGDSEIFVYRSVVIENETSNATVARLGVQTPDVFYLRQFFPAFNLDIPQVYDNAVIVVRQRERLQVQLTATTDGDNLKVYVEGYVRLVNPSSQEY